VLTLESMLYFTLLYDSESDEWVAGVWHLTLEMIDGSQSEALSGRSALCRLSTVPPNSTVVLVSVQLVLQNISGRRPVCIVSVSL